MRRIVFCVFIVWLFYGCEEVVNLDLPERDPRLVIEGLITNEYDSYFVKLTRTAKYSFKYDAAAYEYETGAIVIVTDNAGNIDTLDENSQGIYKTHTTRILGVIGRSYQVDIFTKSGKHFRSEPEEMLDVPKIDRIYFERDKSKRSPDNPDYYLFDIYVDWQDPADVTNYYLRSISYYWSHQWHDNIQWNWVFNDKFFNGLYMKKNNVNEDYGGYNWSFRINQYSLTKNAFRFWNLVHQQTMEAGDEYSNTAVPLIGNVYNVDNQDDYALGYFQVSAKTIAEVYIDH